MTSTQKLTQFDEDVTKLTRQILVLETQQAERQKQSEAAKKDCLDRGLDPLDLVSELAKLNPRIAEIEEELREGLTQLDLDVEEHGKRLNGR